MNSKNNPDCDLKDRFTTRRMVAFHLGQKLKRMVVKSYHGKLRA